MSWRSRASARPRGSVRACTLARASSGSPSPSTAAQRRRSSASSSSTHDRLGLELGRARIGRRLLAPPGRSRWPGGPPRPRGWRPRRRRPPHRGRPPRRGPARGALPRSHGPARPVPAPGRGRGPGPPRGARTARPTWRRPRRRAPRGRRAARALLRGRWSGCGPPCGAGPTARPARPRPGSGGWSAARWRRCRGSGRRRPGAPGGGSGGAPRAPGRPGAPGSRPCRPGGARPARGDAGASAPRPPPR